MFKPFLAFYSFTSSYFVTELRWFVELELQLVMYIILMGLIGKQEDHSPDVVFTLVNSYRLVFSVSRFAV